MLKELVKQTTFYVDNKPVIHPDRLIVSLLASDRFPRTTNFVENRVIPAGESIIMTTVSSGQQAELLYIHQIKNNFRYKDCYESIYEDTWVSTGIEVKEANYN